MLPQKMLPSQHCSCYIQNKNNKECSRNMSELQVCCAFLKDPTVLQKVCCNLRSQNEQRVDQENSLVENAKFYFLSQLFFPYLLLQAFFPPTVFQLNGLSSRITKVTGHIFGIITSRTNNSARTIFCIIVGTFTKCT